MPVPSERSERLEPIVRLPSCTLQVRPALRLTDGTHGVSVLAQEVICDVHIL